MIRGISYFLFFLTLASSLQARAQYSIFSDSEFGPGYGAINTELSYFKNDRKDPGIYFSQWNISAGGSQSKSEDTTTGAETSYKSQSFAAGLGWAYSSWSLDFSILSAKTPETNFTQTGGSLDLSYDHKFDGANEVDFAPRVTAGLSYGSSNIQQELAFTIAGFTVERTVELEQQRYSGGLSYMPVSWLKAKILLTGYAYNKSKEDLQRAFNNRFLNNYTGDLVSTVGGLPESSLSLKLMFYLNEIWDLEALTSVTRLIVDDSLSKRGHLIFSKNFDRWVLGFGVSRNETTETKEFSGLFSLSYQL